MIGWIILSCIMFLVLILLGWIIGFYNTVINAKNDIKNMFSNILTEYQRRVDLFSNLVETVKGSAKFEKDTLKEVIEARNWLKNASEGKGVLSKESSVKSSMDKLSGLDNLFKGINVVFERYPKLTSTESYKELMKEIRITEDRINIARTDYNGIVRDFNVHLTEFPNNLLSRMFAFAEEVFFDTDKKNYDAPKIDLKI